MICSLTEILNTDIHPQESIHSYSRIMFAALVNNSWTMYSQELSCILESQQKRIAEFIEVYRAFLRINLPRIQRILFILSYIILESPLSILENCSKGRWINEECSSIHTRESTCYTRESHCWMFILESISCVLENCMVWISKRNSRESFPSSRELHEL